MKSNNSPFSILHSQFKKIFSFLRKKEHKKDIQQSTNILKNKRKMSLRENFSTLLYIFFMLFLP